MTTVGWSFDLKINKKKKDKKKTRLGFLEMPTGITPKVIIFLCLVFRV
jgi:hypothetical protein